MAGKQMLCMPVFMVLLNNSPSINLIFTNKQNKVVHLLSTRTNRLIVMQKDYRLLSFISIKHLNRGILSVYNVSEPQLLILLALYFGTHYFLDPEKTSTLAISKLMNVSKENVVTDLQHLVKIGLVRRIKFKYNYYHLTEKGFKMLGGYKQRLNNLDLFIDNSQS